MTKEFEEITKSKIDKAINNRKKELDSLKKHDSGEKEIIPKDLQEIVHNMQSKEFEEFDKKLDIFSVERDIGEGNKVSTFVVDVSEVKSFIFTYFFPKRLIKEIMNKIYYEVPEDCDEYSYHRGINDSLGVFLKDLDL